MSEPTEPPSVFARLAMAFIFFFRILFKPQFAQLLLPYRPPLAELKAGGPTVDGQVVATKEKEKPAPLPAPAVVKPVAPPKPAPEKAHASGLFVFSLLQREGRLVDFLQEDIAGFSDAEVGAAARVVHEGCRKVVRQYLTLEPVLKESEGASVNVPTGFDAQRIRLTGNVAGQPPYNGALRHHGWVATALNLPDVPEALDARIIAPAEVELS